MSLLRISQAKPACVHACKPIEILLGVFRKIVRENIVTLTKTTHHSSSHSFCNFKLENRAEFIKGTNSKFLQVFCSSAAQQARIHGSAGMVTKAKHGDQFAVSVSTNLKLIGTYAGNTIIYFVKSWIKKR